MELLLEGILAIQAGANPRVVEQRLLSYLSPSEQEAAKEAREAAKTKEAA
jgi:chemotaxis protein MotA